MTESVRRVAVVGAGTVGASWALYFLSRGLDVTVYDPDPGREAFARELIERGWAGIRAVDSALPAEVPLAAFHSRLEEAVAGADYVQESAPDVVGIKRELFARLAALLPDSVIVGSSTSSLLMSELQEGISTAERFVVAHPFNPPHLIPV